MNVLDLPVVDGFEDYAGQLASIESNGSNCLPWSIVLHEPMRRLCDCGSYETAYKQFKAYGLRSI